MSDLLRSTLTARSSALDVERTVPSKSPRNVLLSGRSAANSTRTIPPPNAVCNDNDSKGLWANYLDTSYDVDTEMGKYRVYLNRPRTNGILFFFVHGAGSSALTFACLALQLRLLNPSYGALLVDIRGHGETLTRSDEDLALATLETDMALVFAQVRMEEKWEKCPEICLCGHSLGGAVCVGMALRRLVENVFACAVLDVVEGSALAGLDSMTSFLKNRPREFNFLGDAIQWHLQSRFLRNADSARISVPPLFVEIDTTWRWRTSLEKTQKFWKGMYRKCVFR